LAAVISRIQFTVIRTLHHLPWNNLCFEILCVIYRWFM